MKFEMLEEGTHSEGDRLYRKGDVFESHDPLHELLPGRFRRAGSHTARPETETIPGYAGINAENRPVMSTLGDDISEEFPNAAKKDLKVYKDGKHYRVADADNIQKALDNGMLTSRIKAAAFIEEYGS